jgi:predicted PurR-regulated permease PerM
MTIWSFLVGYVFGGIIGLVVWLLVDWVQKRRDPR